MLSCRLVLERILLEHDMLLGSVLLAFLFFSRLSFAFHLLANFTKKYGYGRYLEEVQVRVGKLKWFGRPLVFLAPKLKCLASPAFGPASGFPERISTPASKITRCDTLPDEC